MKISPAVETLPDAVENMVAQDGRSPYLEPAKKVDQNSDEVVAEVVAEVLDEPNADIEPLSRNASTPKNIGAGLEASKSAVSQAVSANMKWDEVSEKTVEGEASGEAQVDGRKREYASPVPNQDRSRSGSASTDPKRKAEDASEVAKKKHKVVLKVGRRDGKALASNKKDEEHYRTPVSKKSEALALVRKSEMPSAQDVGSPKMNQQPMASTEAPSQATTKSPENEGKPGATGGGAISTSSSGDPERPTRPAKQNHGSAQLPSASRSQNIPEIAPTLPRANPAEMVVTCDKPYVKEQMKDIESSISNAMLSLFQEKQTDPDAQPTIVQRPSSDLEALYKAQWGPDWQKTVFSLTSQKKLYLFLRQKTTFIGLLGTGIKLSVFNAPLPWDVESKLEGDFKYFEQVFNDLGYEAQDVVRYVKGKQIADPKFQKNEVEPLARSLAGSLALTLAAHVKRMTNGKKPPKNQLVEYESWISYLADAMQTAITLKQNLVSSKLGPFRMTWPLNEKDVFNGDWHRPYYELRGTALANADVLHPILPGVWRMTKGSKRDDFSRALIVAE